MRLKGNQSKLYDLTRKQFSKNQWSTEVTTIEKGHNREETRKCRVINLEDASSLDQDKKDLIREWKNLTSIIQVERSGHDKGKTKIFMNVDSSFVVRVLKRQRL